MNNVIWALDKPVDCLLSISQNNPSLFFFCLSGAIYLKNHINTYWSDYNEPKLTSDSDIITLANAVSIPIGGDSTQKLFVVSDPDKEYLRNVLIDAIIRTKDPLR